MKMKNRICAWIVALCLCLGMIMTVCAADALQLTYQLTADGKSEIYVKPGETITVTFRVKRTDSDEGYKLYALDNDVEYDRSFFEPVGCVSVFADGCNSDFDQRLRNDQTIVRVSAMACEFEVEETVCTFQLKVVGTSGSSTLVCSEELAVDTGGADAEIRCENLTVVIGDDPQAEEPGEPEEPDEPEWTGDEPFENPFCDVQPGWYYDAVMWAVKNGITEGMDETHFDPELGCTRAQVVTFLWRAAGCPIMSGAAGKFTDVVAGSYYEKAVIWAVRKGITKGTSEMTFDPELVCNRAQFITLLARYAGVRDADTESRFTDVNEDEYFAAAVKWADDNNVTNGTGNNQFSPYMACTRAHVVTFLYRWMGE